ncbi:MAG: signal peptidase I [Xenococcaceae cyanobacterium]
MNSEDKNLGTANKAQSSPQQIQTNPSSQTNVWQQVRENGLTLIIAILLALIIRIFIAEPRYIPSDSMFPTLQQGDRLVIEKVSYHFHSPQRGDIIVFQPPSQLQMQGYEQNQAFIKRAIALEGDIISVQNRVVFINDRPLQENYIAELPQYNLPPVRVPEGKIFVMGDNRNNSNDSHIWGFLPEKNIIGRAVFRFFPFSRFGAV